jgi:exopolysaccharide biosynthesis protein
MSHNLFAVVMFAAQVARVVSGDLIFVPAPPVASDPGINVKHLFLSTDRQEVIKAVLTTVTNPVGFVHPYPSQLDGCTGLDTTPHIAERWGCEFAINGSPFDMKTGHCLGSLIAEGKTWLLDETSGYSSWGLTADGRWVFGKNVNSSTVEREQVTDLLSGFIGPLLVENGAAISSTSTLIAQRQAVGVLSNGVLVFLTIDGAEDPPRGMNITELGNAMVSLGAIAALNLDGGGSTTTWMNGKLVDRPTCNDTVFPSCMRNVANIVCVAPGALRTSITN